MWLHNNQANEEHCRIVPITPHPQRGFEEFPAATSLSGFDRSDRKFVAVALASNTKPRVANASDTDWWDHSEALRDNGVEVLFLCPELMPKP